MKKQKILNVYIAVNKDNPADLEICKHSIRRNSSIPINFVFLDQQNLIDQGLCSDEANNCISRFFVPYLNQYQDLAVYVDSNILFIEDIAKLIENIDTSKAVHVVKHAYPNNPRNQWTSLMVWNCKHTEHQNLNPEYIVSQNIKNLNNLSWIKDTKIGELAPIWNWIDGWYRELRDGYPSAINYINGTPDKINSQNYDYADRWYQCQQSFKNYKNHKEYIVPDNLTLPNHVKQYFTDLLRGKLDPYQLIHQHDVKSAIDYFNHISMPECLGLLDCEDDNGEPLPVKDDHVIANFCIGSGGQFGTSKQTKSLPVNIPAVIRGIAKKKTIHACIEQGRDYYYIDTGYFGNNKHKNFHRITKNGMQYVGKLDPECPSNRFELTGESLKKFRPGRNILICPPSQKAMSYWNMDLIEWLENTVAEIKQHTDRPIVIREKQPRSVRVNTDTIQMALEQDVHCMVTFNSIAAVESLMNGKPVFTIGPTSTNAAEPLSNKNLKDIDNPFIPSLDEVYNLCCNLAYQQFTVKEMRNGIAWRMLNGL
jgi:lipopolysaccharide biosynthesis glycosyltransferase